MRFLGMVFLLVFIQIGIYANQQWEFAADFPVLFDQGGVGEGKKMRGFGGISRKKALKKIPIIFIHGNGGTHENMIALAELFLTKGYSKQELWAISYMNYPGERDKSYKPHTNEVKDIDQFVKAVISYTGAKKVHIIAHSLGVSLVLYWMKTYSTYHLVENFVAITGAPHGFPNFSSSMEWSGYWMENNLRYQGDETPFSKVKDQKKNHIPPDKEREIRYIVVHLGEEDKVLNRFGPNSKTALLEGADATFNLANQITLSEKATDFEKLCGSHCSIVLNPKKLFETIKDFF